MAELTTSIVKDVTVQNDTSTSTTVQLSNSGTLTTATAELVGTKVTSSSPKDTSTSVPKTSSKETSLSSTKSATMHVLPKTTTEVSVVAPESVTPTTTSTITDHPESTFSTPVPISTVDPENGEITLTTPAVVTVLSTSTQPDGGFATYTHVIANPSTANDTQVTQTGFLANRGAVAGVFVVVGILACTICFFLALFCRRRHRRNRQKRWLESIQRQRPLSFSTYEGSQSPQMRSLTPDIGHFLGNRTPIPSSEDRRPSFDSSNGRNHSDIAPLVSNVLSPRRVPVPTVNPFDDPSPAAGLVGYGLGYGSEYGRFRREKLDAASIAQSSPSIYPASLPPSGDGDNTDATHSPATENSFDIPSPKAVASQAPPRPPRSHLRRSLTKPFEMYPITPPSSVSSHTYPDSPLDATKVVRRKTLLDVRPRQILEPTEDI